MRVGDCGRVQNCNQKQDTKPARHRYFGRQMKFRKLAKHRSGASSKLVLTISIIRRYRHADTLLCYTRNVARSILLALNNPAELCVFILDNRLLLCMHTMKTFSFVDV